MCIFITLHIMTCGYIYIYIMPKRCSIVSTTCLSPSQATDMGPCKKGDRVPCWMARKGVRLLERRMSRTAEKKRRSAT